MKLIVRTFYHQGKAVAEWLNPVNGKVSYFSVDKVAKRIAIGTNSRYLVKVKKGHCIRVLKQISNKPFKKSDVTKILKSTKDL